MHRDWVISQFARLREDQRRVQLSCEPHDNFVLHFEEISDGPVELVGPQMSAGLRIDELNVDPHAGPGPLDASFEHITDVKLAADHLHIERLALECEGGAARDDESASDPRQRRGQTVRHAFDEILLLLIAADIGKR